MDIHEKVRIDRETQKQVDTLVAARKIAPAAATALDAKIREIRAFRASSDLAVAYCEECGAEWDGRGIPPEEVTEDCGHAEMREISGELRRANIRRRKNETLDDFLDRYRAAVSVV